jgi:hypothetical protein
MWAAWQTWQVASFCPFAWEWLRLWATNKTNSVARVKVNTLARLSRWLCLPTISILWATPIFPLRVEQFHSGHTCELRKSPTRTVNYYTPG